MEIIRMNTVKYYRYFCRKKFSNIKIVLSEPYL
jgi:hypothetical protein